MTLDEVIERRRSVRAYVNRPVEADKVRAVCEAARKAPSACNSQTWRFVIVDDRALIERICREGMRTILPNRWLEQAPLIIVGCSVLDILANRVGSMVTGIEYYQIDLAIAIEHMVLKAVELGLGTCWIGWFRERKIKEILHIPRRVRVSALLAMGYPQEPLPEPRPRKEMKDIVFHNSWTSSLPF